MTQPVPARCATLPTLPGGMVVPWVALTGRGGPVLGALDAGKVAQCLLEALCQVCGQQLSRPYVVLVRETDAARNWSPDPALHPECAGYSARVCPMLAGRQDRYVTTVERVERAGWTGARQGEPRPIVPWHAVWLRDPYTVVLDALGRPSGLRWGTALRVRPVAG